ncbi:hypothetical protein PYW08_002579 [Mythimna loreyi]|uniref:Uncharacterized protein n=1 Tax=Mythimna loreyi TaxID=667449 RepID=A0ACC2QJH6_9NEOP|nr:hypothetical protein PYW08_002579 [Mythimna loreyi]
MAYNSCKYYTDRTLGWMLNNKIIVLLSLLTFSLFVSTLTLSGQKKRLSSELQECLNRNVTVIPESTTPIPPEPTTETTTTTEITAAPDTTIPEPTTTETTTTTEITAAPDTTIPEPTTTETTTSSDTTITEKTVTPESETTGGNLWNYWSDWKNFSNNRKLLYS